MTRNRSVVKVLAASTTKVFGLNPDFFVGTLLGFTARQVLIAEVFLHERNFLSR